MTVKIVTDSIADLPAQVVQDLFITTVPLMIQFGELSYRDGVDITPDEFYEKLRTGIVMPTTSVPSPVAFADVFDRLAEETDEILTITVSSRLSGTYQVALQGKELMHKKCRVEVIDSTSATIAQGFIVMAAARAALKGASVAEIIAVVKQNIPRVDFLTTFDTLEYLRRGGRIGKAQALLGSMLKINPLITLRNGVVEPAGRARSREKGIERLYEFVAGYTHIDELAVGDTACAAEADALAARIATLHPGKQIYRSRMTPAIGTHTGPGLLLVAVMGDKKG